MVALKKHISECKNYQEKKKRGKKKNKKNKNKKKSSQHFFRFVTLKKVFQRNVSACSKPVLIIFIHYFCKL